MLFFNSKRIPTAEEIPMIVWKILWWLPKNITYVFYWDLGQVPYAVRISSITSRTIAKHSCHHNHTKFNFNFNHCYIFIWHILIHYTLFKIWKIYIYILTHLHCKLWWQACLVPAAGQPLALQWKGIEGTSPRTLCSARQTPQPAIYEIENVLLFAKRWASWTFSSFQADPWERQSWRWLLGDFADHRAWVSNFWGI